MPSSEVTVFPEIPGISTEPLSSKAEFGMGNNKPGCLEDKSHCVKLSKILAKFPRYHPNGGAKIQIEVG